MTRDSRKTSDSRSRATSRPARAPRRPGAARSTSIRSASSATTSAARAVRKRRSPRSMRRLAVVGALIVFLAVVIAPTLRSYLSQRQQVSKLRAQVAAQQADVASLQQTEHKWSDPKYVEAQAGQRLGFVKPGQTLTVYVTDDKSAAATEAKSKQSQTWYGTLWRSVVASGEH